MKRPNEVTHPNFTVLSEKRDGPMSDADLLKHAY